MLRESTITDRTVKLPCHLDRALYVRVKRVLVAAGGTWSRAEGAHVFRSDPRRILRLPTTP